MSFAYNHLRKQRLLILNQLFKTLDIYAEHSLNPSLFEQYEEIKKELLTRYKK